MSDLERLQLARRMSGLLQRELGEGIDVQRMVAQPLYARDVLLVCQAMPETELPALAQDFLAAGRANARGMSEPYALGEGDPSGEPSLAPDSTSGDSRIGSDSTPSGWVASLWPATMRGGLFGGRGKKRGVPKPR